MEVTKCVTTSLPSLNRISNDVISSVNVPNDVALTLDKLPPDHSLQIRSSSTENTLVQETNAKGKSLFLLSRIN